MIFLSTLVICATFVWLARESKPFLTRKLDLVEKGIEGASKLAVLDESYRQQEIDLRRQELVLKDKDVSRPSPSKLETPPEDLIRSAMSEAAPWAQEDALKRLYELYDLTKSWDAVRGVYDLEMSR